MRNQIFICPLYNLQLNSQIIPVIYFIFNIFNKNKLKLHGLYYQMTAEFKFTLQKHTVI